MRTLFTLLGRELKSYFYSPIAYVVMFFFLIATGFNFYSGVMFLNRSEAEVTVVEASFNTVLFWFPFILIFSLITMRAYADEFRMGTFEMVTTAPVQDWQVVAAKFLGAFLFYSLLWVPSFGYFVAFQFITGKQAAMAAGAYGGTYLLLALVGMLYCSIGCLASALTKEQINAAVMTFVAVFGAFLGGLITFIFNVTNPVLRDLISYVSAIEHMADFSRGMIDSRPIVWYLSMTALVLFINLQVFQYRKWKA
jgi:ABC-2 type transport system permease protein